VNNSGMKCVQAFQIHPALNGSRMVINKNWYWKY